MKKLTMVAMLAIVALLGLSGAATAATIDVTNLGAGLNVEVQGRIEFISPVATIICDKTMIGRLNARVEGTLGLTTNNAGIIGDIRLANCRGGRATALVDLAGREVRLSWVNVRNRSTVTLGGSNARFLIEAIGVRCLYTAEMIGTANPEVRGLYRERLELALLGVTEDGSNSIFCPDEEDVDMRGSLTVTRPNIGIGVSLR